MWKFLSHDIVLKKLSEQKQRASLFKKKMVFNWHRKILYSLEYFLNQKWKWLHTYHTFGILLLLYFLLWHPGWGIRSLPENQSILEAKKLLPLKAELAVRNWTQVQIHTKQSTISLIRRNRVISLYSAYMPALQPGNYVVTAMEWYGSQQTMVVVIGTYLLDIDRKILLKDRCLQAPSTQTCVELDQAAWEQIYPYVTLGTPVLID